MEEKSLEKYGMDREIKVTTEQLALVKSVIFPDSTDDELKLYVYECQRRGVHPLDRKIYPIKRAVGDTGEKRITFQTSIDLMRSESEGTNTYAGIDEPEYGPEGKEGYPEWAKITVYKWVSDPGGQFHRTPFTGIARWKEYYPGEKLGFMWRKMPHHMLAKCSEAIARRLAWPQILDQLYIPEELSAREQTTSTGYTETVKQRGEEPSKTPTGNAEKSHQGGLGKSRLGKTVNDTLKEEIDALAADIEERQRILTAVSSYTDETGNQRFIEYDKILKGSNRWAGKALANLRKQHPKIEKEANGQGFAKPLICTNDPRTCDFSAWEQTEKGLVAWCVDDKTNKTKGECPYSPSGE